MIRFVELDASTERSSYTEIAVGHEAVLQGLALVLGSFPGAATKNYFGDYRIPPVGVYELRDCAVSSDGLLIREGAFFTSLQLLITEKIVNECARYGELTASRIPRRVIEEPVALLSGPGNVIWGRWLIDLHRRPACWPLGGNRRKLLASASERPRRSSDYSRAYRPNP